MSGGKFSRFLGATVTLSLGLAGLMFLAYVVSEGRRSGFEFSLLGVGGASGLFWFIFRGPVGKMLASMMEAGALDADTAQRFAELEHQVALLQDRGFISGEVEQAYTRINELEERLEFTERLLARGQEVPRGS